MGNLSTLAGWGEGEVQMEEKRSEKKEERVPRRKRWATASNIVERSKQMRTILEVISLGE